MIRILYTNANSLHSKISSLLKLTEKSGINIVAITKTKVSNPGLIKIPNFCQSYELISQEKKGGGLYISTNSLHDTCLIEKGNDEYQFITLQIDCKNISWRLLLTNGHQENEPESKRKRFFQETETQINNATISNTPIFWVGDLNGKLGQNYIKGHDHQTTRNDELIIDIIKKYSLMLLNSPSIYSGLWTQFGKNTRASVLDYVIISHEMI